MKRPGRRRIALAFGLAALAAAGWAALERHLRASEHPLASHIRRYYLEPFEPIFRCGPKAGGLECRNPSAGQRREVIAVPKPPDALRVFVVGGSIAAYLQYQWGPRPWARELARLVPGRRVELINLGRGGHDSLRDLSIARETARYGPDYVVVLSGNNEFIDPPSLRFPRAAYLLDRLSALPFLSRAARPKRAYDRAERDRQFEANLRALARAVAASGARPVLCTLPNLRGGMVPGDLPFDQQAFARAWEAFETGRPAHAERALRAFLAERPDDPIGHFYLGKALEGAGRLADARESFARAAELNGAEHLCPPSRNELIRRIAREEGAILADLEREFLALDPTLGYRIFLDPVHWYLEYSPFAAAAITEAIARQAGRWDLDAIAAWKRDAARVELTPGSLEIYLYYKLAFLARGGAWHWAQPIETLAGLERLLPGTLENLRGVRRRLPERPPLWPLQDLRDEDFPRLLWYAGIELRRQGRPDLSLEFMEPFADPGNPWIESHRAWSKAALARGKISAPKAPREDRALHAAGRLWGRPDLLARAIEAYRRRPETADRARWLGAALIDAGREREAAELLMKSAERWPGHGGLRLERARLAQKQGRVEDLLKELTHPAARPLVAGQEDAVVMEVVGKICHADESAPACARLTRAFQDGEASASTSNSP